MAALRTYLQPGDEQGSSKLSNVVTLENVGLHRNETKVDNNLINTKPDC